MSPLTRRRFLQAGSMVAAASTIPVNFARAAAVYDAAPHAGAPELKALIDAALNAATAAGATYADVHYCLSQEEGWGSFREGRAYTPPQANTFVSLGVRSLVNGYWGFAGSDGIPGLDKAAQLGKSATAQAKTAATGKSRTTELAKTPPVTGSWVMPIEIDPFTAVTLEEKNDFMGAVADLFGRVEYYASARYSVQFHKAQRAFASSEGSYTTQTTYMTDGTMDYSVMPDWLTDAPTGGMADFLSPAGAGWEYIRKAPFRERARELIDIAKRGRRAKPVDVGRYDIVFDAKAMAAMLNESVCAATSITRALGYEANDAGTSYLDDPLTMLGTFKMGSPLLTVTSDRSLPGGVATARWDDEGVAPPKATIVKEGILQDYQTTRESASWLAPYYQKAGLPVQSNGCAYALGGTIPPTLRNPNLVLQPGTAETSFDELVKGTKKGIAIIGALTNADQQAKNVNGYAHRAHEINNGVLGTALSNVMFNYRGPDFWKNLVAVGGPSSVRQVGFSTSLVPRENMYRRGHTISAVPGKVLGVAITDSTKK